MKWTTTSLIEELQKFPEDLEIITELSLLWNYPPEIMEGNDISTDEFKEYSQNKADELLIFEGSWEKDNISDVDNILKDYVQVKNVYQVNNKDKGMIGKLYRLYQK